MFLQARPRAPPYDQLVSKSQSEFDALQIVSVSEVLARADRQFGFHVSNQVDQDETAGAFFDGDFDQTSDSGIRLEIAVPQTARGARIAEHERELLFFRFPAAPQQVSKTVRP